MKACGCAGDCLHCQVCWRAGHRHPEYNSPGGLGSHAAAHRGKPDPTPSPKRSLNRGERVYMRRRLEHVALALAAELHLDPQTVLAAIPAVLKAPRERDTRVNPAEIPLTGPAIIVGLARLQKP